MKKVTRILALMICMLSMFYNLHAQSSSYDQEPNDCFPSRSAWVFSSVKHNDILGHSNYAGDYDFFRIQIRENGTNIFFYLKVWAVGGQRGKYAIRGEIIGNNVVVTTLTGYSDVNLYIHFYSSGCGLLNGPWTTNSNSLPLSSFRQKSLDKSLSKANSPIQNPHTNLNITNSPNPFSTHTNIEYTLAQDDKVSINVYDITGKQIKQVLGESQQSAGTHQIHLDGTDLPDGIYLVNIRSSDQVETHRMRVTK